MGDPTISWTFPGLPGGSASRNATCLRSTEMSAARIVGRGGGATVGEGEGPEARGDAPGDALAEGLAGRGEGLGGLGDGLAAAGEAEESLGISRGLAGV
jgi:hypothetical protein